MSLANGDVCVYLRDGGKLLIIISCIHKSTYTNLSTLKLLPGIHVCHIVCQLAQLPAL